MAKIQTIAIPQVQRAVYPGVQMDMNAAMAPLQGKMAIAKGIGDIAQVTQQFGLRVAKAREEATLADNARQLNESLGAFQAEIATEPDPTRWPSMFQKHAEDAKKAADMAGSKLGPDGRARLNEQVANWSSENLVRVTTQARIGEVREQAKKFSDAAFAFYDSGNKEAGDKQLSKGWELGVYSDAQVEDLMHVGAQKADRAMAVAAINADPIAAQKILEDEKNFTNLSNADRLALKNQARENTEHLRYDTVQQYDEQILSIQNHEIAAGDIEQRMKADLQAGKMLPSQYRMLEGRLLGKGDHTQDAVLASELWDAALAIDRTLPANEQRQQEMAIRNAVAGLSPELKRPVLDALEDARKTSPSEKPAGAALEWVDKFFESGAGGPTRIEQIFKSETEPATIDAPGWFTGNIPNPRAGQPKLKDNAIVYIYDKNGNKIPDEKASKQLQDKVAETVLLRDRVKKQVYAWAKSNPDKTPFEQVEYAKKLISQNKELSGASLIYDSLDLNFTEDNGNN